MGRLDVSVLRYMSRDEFRVLTAVEMGMRNHELVPVSLISSIANLRHGGIQKLISQLMRNGLLAYESAKGEGYRLTNKGYDFLALKTFLSRGLIAGLGPQIGVGKESDVFLAVTADGEELAIKFHRLGRTSFRAVKNKRDYLGHRKTASWLYLSRLAALKEYSFMKALYDRDFPVPKPVDQNRHAVLMEKVQGFPLYQVRRLMDSESVYNSAMSILVRLARCGLIHCDYNEFNLLLDDEGKVTLIDFPQMISTSHPNAEELFNRDVGGVVKFFSRLQGGAYAPDEVPVLSELLLDMEGRMDMEVEASGFTKEMEQELQTELGKENEEEAGEQDVEHAPSQREGDLEEEGFEVEGISHQKEKTEDQESEEEEKAGAFESEDGLEEDVLVEDSQQRGEPMQQTIKRKVKRAFLKQKSSRQGSRNSAKDRIKGRTFHKERF